MKVGRDLGFELGRFDFEGARDRTTLGKSEVGEVLGELLGDSVGDSVGE
jgi:hypothetical protein